MPFPLEAVPNFSEGREPATVDAIGDALSRTRGCWTSTSTRTTTARCSRWSAPRRARHGAGGRRRRARELIDLERHEGVHPCIGAADVLPVVPIRHEDMPRARAAALRLAQRIGEELGLPAFLYGEELAPGRGPAFFRRGGVAALQERMDAGELGRASGLPGSTRAPVRCSSRGPR